MDGFTESIVVVLGSPIGGNPTQFAIEKGLASIQLDWRVLSLEVAPENLEVAIEGFRVTGIRAVWLDSNLASDDSDGFVRKEGQWESFEIRHEASERLAARLPPPDVCDSVDAAEIDSSDHGSRASDAINRVSKNQDLRTQDSSNRNSSNRNSSKRDSRKSPDDKSDPPLIPSKNFAGAELSSVAIETPLKTRELAEQIQVCFEVWADKEVALEVLIEAIEEYQSV